MEGKEREMCSRQPSQRPWRSRGVAGMRDLKTEKAEMDCKRRSCSRRQGRQNTNTLAF